MSTWSNVGNTNEAFRPMGLMLQGVSMVKQSSGVRT